MRLAPRRAPLQRSRSAPDLSDVKEQRGLSPQWAMPCGPQLWLSPARRSPCIGTYQSTEAKPPVAWAKQCLRNHRLVLAMIDRGPTAVRAEPCGAPRHVRHTSRACIQVTQGPGSRRVVSTEWTAAGIRAAANAGDKAVARTRRRTGMQRHGSVASALEASPLLQRIMSQCSQPMQTIVPNVVMVHTYAAVASTLAACTCNGCLSVHQSSLSMFHMRTLSEQHEACRLCDVCDRAATCCGISMRLQRVLNSCASAGHGPGLVALGHQRRLRGRSPDQGPEQH